MARWARRGASTAELPVRLLRFLVSCLAVVTVQAGTAHAQPTSIGSEPAGPPPKDWTFDIGPGVVIAPWFEGSANYRVLPIPNLDLRYQRDKVFISARDGIGATLLDVSGFKAGPIFRYRFPRNQGDGGYLYGTGNVPFTIEGGAFLRYDQPFFAAKVELRRGIGGSNGLIFDALVDGKLRLSDSVFLSGGPRLSVTDGTFNQAYFGITALQSINSGYAQYYPGAGLRSVGVGASALWRIHDQLSFVAFGSYNYLADTVANSPIVTGPGGSRNQFVAGAALTWRFSW
ncbi:MAG: MipA/OmpV family protein [Reyranella sp.]|nr:MAG: MipA/OmpV family protein [Reyranella sp.]TBR28369.1 MAG: MipA/OmpV family protein [Reyranella sp.]